MEVDDWLEAIDRDGHRLGDAAARSLDRQVPTCPDWTQARLVGHIGMVHRLATHAVATGSAPEKRGRPPEDSDYMGWFEDGLDGLIELFGRADPTAEAWNFSPSENTAGFWWRRMAQETAMHRWDAEGAVGEPGTIEPRLATDGIDEWLDVFVRMDTLSSPGSGPGDSSSIHVHCSDTDGEWWARREDGKLRLEREHRKGDVVLRGNSADLLLVLWGRRPPSLVEVLGDDELLSSWLKPR